MPRFRYTATNEKGKTVRGLLEAPSEEALYAKLRTDGLYMTDAQEAQKALATFRPPVCRWCVRSASWRTSAPSTPARRPCTRPS